MKITDKIRVGVANRLGKSSDEVVVNYLLDRRELYVRTQNDKRLAWGTCPDTFIDEQHLSVALDQIAEVIKKELEWQN